MWPAAYCWTYPGACVHEVLSGLLLFRPPFHLHGFLVYRDLEVSDEIVTIQEELEEVHHQVVGLHNAFQS